MCKMCGDEEFPKVYPVKFVDCECSHLQDVHMEKCIPEWFAKKDELHCFATQTALTTPGTPEWQERFARIERLDGMWDYFKEQ